MKKINIIKKSDEFSSIIKKRNGVSNKYFILNIENNDSNIPKFGITFVKHIGNAVTRNKLKRRTKSIIDNNKNIYQDNKKYIIIIKKDAVDITYQEMEQQLISIFKKGEQYEK
jgi:ribonuclease P protein component